jgi:hypothetical protein
METSGVMSDAASCDRIERILRAQTDGFFEDVEIREHMRVALRITVEFSQFLRDHELEPEAAELSHVMESIHSGIDGFFLVGYTCRSFAGLEESWLPERRLPTSYSELRAAALVHFHMLVASYFPWGESRFQMPAARS